MWQFSNKIFFFLNVRISLNDCRLLDIIGDFVLNFSIYRRFLWDLFKDFKITIFLQVIRTNFWYNRANSVNVISKDYAAHCFNEDHTKSLLMISRNYVTKPYSKHNRNSPIIPPHILLIPQRLIQPFPNNPILFMIQTSHSYERNSQTMRNNKIKQEHFYEIPYLLTILIFYQN